MKQPLPQHWTVSVHVADESHFKFAEDICTLIADAAKKRGTGIARRTPEYLRQKMQESKAIIALGHASEDADIAEDVQSPIAAGFCYIETWSDKRYVANSGLIVAEAFRKSGLAREIKQFAFKHSRTLFPHARMFGITTSHAVMKINSELGYLPVPYSELTDDEEFWRGCNTCPNVDILERTERKMCLCTAMLCLPASQLADRVRPSRAKQQINSDEKTSKESTSNGPTDNDD